MLSLPTTKTLLVLDWNGECWDLRIRNISIFECQNHSWNVQVKEYRLIVHGEAIRAHCRKTRARYMYSLLAAPVPHGCFASQLASRATGGVSDECVNLAE